MELFSPRYQALDANGMPVSGALLSFFRGGTSQQITIYQDSTGTTPHTNPVVADAAGNFAAIFLPEETSYKFILKTS
ncbi:MAG: tail fiber protein, partial [Oxalobacteraceae bacterium]